MSAVEQTFCFGNVSSGHGNLHRAVTEPECSQMLCTFSVTNENFFFIVTKMNVEELHHLNAQLLIQIQSKCFLLTLCLKLYNAAD